MICVTHWSLGISGFTNYQGIQCIGKSIDVSIVNNTRSETDKNRRVCRYIGAVAAAHMPYNAYLTVSEIAHMKTTAAVRRTRRGH